MSEISSEAVEAAARMGRVMGWQHLVRYSGMPKGWMDDVLGALASAALAAHQPARVVPSAEEVQAAVARVVAPYVSGPLDPLDVKVTDAVLILYASQPTVAQVREQVAREIEAAGRDDDRWHKTCDDYRAVGWDGDPDDYERMFWQSAHTQAARIARAETKGGE